MIKYFYVLLFTVSALAWGKGSREVFVQDKAECRAELAEQFGLQMADPENFTIERVGPKSNFRFVDADGKRITDKETLERIKKLGIPPMWRDVSISTNPTDHLQVVGIDEAGRQQSLYHKDWEQVRNKMKFDRLEMFAHALPAIREAVHHDMQLDDPTNLRYMQAVVVSVLDLTGIRPGNPQNLKDYDSRGATTLLKSNVETRKTSSNVTLDFIGKKGLHNIFEFNDRDTATALKRIKDSNKRKEMFAIQGRDGFRLLRPMEMNNYIAEIAGGDFTMKDFRTWKGTVAAVEFLADKEVPESERAQKRLEKEMGKHVADVLNNTGTIALKSYIDHDIFVEFVNRGGFKKIMSQAKRRSLAWRDLYEEMTTILLDETSDTSS